jgi:hypothetical protein
MILKVGCAQVVGPLLTPICMSRSQQGSSGGHSGGGQTWTVVCGRDGSHRVAVNAAVTGCPAGQPSTAAVSGLSVSCSAIGGGAAPLSR